MKARDMLQAARLLRLAVAMALAILLQAISPQGLALAYSATDEWLVYWYLCCSDLESVHHQKRRNNHHRPQLKIHTPKEVLHTIAQHPFFIFLGTSNSCPAPSAKAEHHSPTSHSERLRFSESKLTPILNIFLSSAAKGSA